LIMHHFLRACFAPDATAKPAGPAERGRSLMTRAKFPVHGAFLIDKPLGWTSHDAVARLRSTLGTREVGHAGTLDPLATGLLVVCAGAMTKCLEFLTGHDKTYLADFIFGATSETLDAEGPLAPSGQAPPATGEPLEEALRVLAAGPYLQTPPRYSAKKIAGLPAYKIARAGGEVTLQPKEVFIRRFEVLSYRLDAEAGTARAEVRAEVSSGFYVRSLARDLGERLGCGGYLGGLRRETVGGLSLARAVLPEGAEREEIRARLFGSVLGPDEIFSELLAVEASPDAARRIDLGQASEWPLETPASPGERLWLRGPNHFRALARAGADGRKAIVLKRLSVASRAFAEFQAELAKTSGDDGAFLA
jgi:tRNA pseudouridine55 synthase